MEETVFTLEEIERALLSCPKFKVTPKENPVISSMSFEDIETVETKMLLYRLITSKYGSDKFHDYDKFKMITDLNRNAILELSINELYLSTRMANILRCADITKIGQLITWRKRDLLKLRNCGERTVKDLEKQLLKKYNLKFTLT